MRNNFNGNAERQMADFQLPSMPYLHLRLPQAHTQILRRNLYSNLPILVQTVGSPPLIESKLPIQDRREHTKQQSEAVRLEIGLVLLKIPDITHKQQLLAT